MQKNYKEERPEKEIFSESRREVILRRAEEFVKDDLLPNPSINKIILFGSLVRGNFGRYQKKYKGRIYSDIDTLLLVDNDFEVPDSWEIHFNGNPEFEGDLYRVYNYKKVEGKFLVQYVVCRRKSYQKQENQEEAERWGVPLKLEDSKHACKVIHS